MLAKAVGLPADELVLDLEDSVPAAGKAEARSRVAALLATEPWRARLVAVRINAIGTPWWRDDIAAMATTGHARLSLVLPKAERTDDIIAVEKGIRDAGGNAVGVQALIETARGLAAVQAIAAASERLQALIIGYADLAASLGRPPGSTAPWLAEQHAVLLAARVNGLQAIDGPYFRIDAGDGLRRQAEETAALGFDGKWAIHPSHLAVINEVFTPTPEEVERARSLVAQLDDAGAAGAGASAFRGEMVDEAMRSVALRTLARAGIETGST